MIRTPVLVFLVLLIMIPSLLQAGTTGRLTGKVTSSDGMPLVGATVMVNNTFYGTMTDENGFYSILGLPAGTYTISSRIVGMSTQTRENVQIVSDLTTTINFTLELKSVGSTTIEVTDQRGQILQDVSSTIHIINREDIESMPVAGIIDILELQPGITYRSGGLHVRGGRSGELQFLVDGIPVRSPITNALACHIPSSAIAEASVLTGGFQAEYGGAMSGVVNIVTREGGSDYEGEVSYEMGSRTEIGSEEIAQNYSRPSENDTYRGNLTNFEFAFGGPDPITTSLLPLIGLDIPGELRFFAAGEWNRSGFDFEDSRGFWENNPNEERNGALKITWNPGPATRISITGLYNYQEQGWDEWAWHLYSPPSIEPDENDTLPVNYVLPLQFDENYSVSITLHQLLGDKYFLEVILNRSRILHWHRVRNINGSYVGEGYTFYDWYNYIPELRQEYPEGFFITGIHPEVWVDSRSLITNGLISLTAQINPSHRIKVGIEGNHYDIYDFSVFADNFSSLYLNRWDAQPRSFAGYIQDRIEFQGGMTADIGFRLDYFDPRCSVFDIEETSAIEVKPKTSLNPRIGFTHPVTNKAVLFFDYGHYSQMPNFNQMYFGTDYSLSGAYSITGNPDLQPENTISYEAGLRYMISDASSITLSAFYKDITGLISTQEASEESNKYHIYENDDSHGTVRGFEAQLVRRQSGWLSGNVSYEFSIAQGRYSSPINNYVYNEEEFTFPPEEDSYLDWDQRQSASANVRLEIPRNEGPVIGNSHFLEGSGLSVKWYWGSGYPYSPPSGESAIPSVNTRRYPWTMNTDLQISRKFWAGGQTFTMYCTIFNLFNRRNIDHIYDAAWFEQDHDGDGSPDHDPTGPYGNPGAWSPARQVLLGLKLEW